MNRVGKIFAAIALSLAVSCISDKTMEGDGTIVGVGDAIPDFSVKMNDGSTVTGSSLRNGVSCIMFFHTECPDCSKTLTQMQPVYGKYASEGVKFALISREEPQQQVSAHWNENGYTMPFSAQSDRSVYNLFATHTVPRVFICKGGTVQALFTDSPPPTYEQISGELNKALGK